MGKSPNKGKNSELDAPRDDEDEVAQNPLFRTPASEQEFDESESAADSSDAGPAPLSPRSPKGSRVGRQRAQRKEIANEEAEEEIKALEFRFQSCFDAMDTDEDGVISITESQQGDKTSSELQAVLQLQGLQPSDAQMQQWRKDYGTLFTRETFVNAMVVFVSEMPAVFTATEWSHSNVGCTRVDCIPVGKDSVSISPDTITIERTKSNFCFCGVKGLSDTASSNIETFRARWIHVQVPLMPLRWVAAYMFEGLLVYCITAFTSAVAAEGYGEKRDAINEMEWTLEKAAAVQNLWFGDNLVVGMIACLIWWGMRLGCQVRSRRGHAYVYATGNVTPPGGLLGDADRVEGRFAIAWHDCEDIVDEFLSHKGCWTKDKQIIKEKEKAAKKSELMKVLSGTGEKLKEFSKSEFLISGLRLKFNEKMDDPEHKGTQMNEDGTEVYIAEIDSQTMIKLLESEPDEQVVKMVDLMLEPEFRMNKEAGQKILKDARAELEGKDLAPSNGDKGLQALLPNHERLEEEDDVAYKARLINLSMQLKEEKFGWYMHGEDSDYLWTAGKVKNGLTEEEYDAQKKSLFGKTLPIPGSLFDLRQKKLRKALVESAGVSRAEQFLGKVQLEEYARAANLNPVYAEGVWQTNPGGRWYVWNRWWLGEETSLFIGEHTFKAGTVMQCGPFCRRREHLAAHVMDLVWVHAGKKGRSLGRIFRWSWGAAQLCFLFSLAISIMWSLAYPGCDKYIGCEHLEVEKPVDYENCEVECAIATCSNITCARWSSCEDIRTQNASATNYVNLACGATDIGLTVAGSLNNDTAAVVGQYASEADRASACEEAHTFSALAQRAYLGMPATCSAVYDPAVRAKAYKLYLDISYLNQDGHWLGPVSHLGKGKRSSQCGGCDDNCVFAAAVEKCSGCKGTELCSPGATAASPYKAVTRNGETITHLHWPFFESGMYPSDFEMCSAIADAGELAQSTFCPNTTWIDGAVSGKPCICMTTWEKLIPHKNAFIVAFAVSYFVAVMVLVYVWLRWVPEVVDMGVSGMQFSRSTSGFVLPPGESVLASIDLLETKLGRTLSLEKVHEPWEYKPTIEHLELLVRGFEESMTVYEDFVHVSVHSGVPICCSTRLSKHCCCEPHGVWADEDSYFLLLENVTFMEVGSDYFWLFEFLTKVFIRLGFFFLLMEYVFMEPLQMFQDVIEELSITWFEDSSEDTSSIMYSWKNRYTISAICFSLYIVFKFLCGKVFKRGYVSIHCLPGGTERGRSSTFMGRSPFFVRLGRPDPDVFRADVETIRAAVKKCRIEVKVRETEKRQQQWSSLLFKGGNATVVKFKDKLKETMNDTGIETSVETSTGDARVDLIEKPMLKSLLSKNSLTTRSVELLLVDQLHLEYYELLGEGQANEVNKGLSLSSEAFGSSLMDVGASARALVTGAAPEPEPQLEETPEEYEERQEKEMAERIAKRNKSATVGRIDLRSVIAVRIIDHTDDEQALFTEDNASNTSALHIIEVDCSHRFSFADDDTQIKWQKNLEQCVRIAQSAHGSATASGNTITRYLRSSDENTLVAAFQAKGEMTDGDGPDRPMSPEEKALRGQVARIFVAIDKDHDHTISFREFSQWLQVGSKNHTADSKAIQVIKEQEEKYKELSLETNSIRMTLDQFWRLMNEKKVIDELKTSGLWQRLAFKHMYDEKTLGQLFDHVCTPGNTMIDSMQLTHCFEQLGSTPLPASEISTLLRIHDRTQVGKLSKSQFVEMMLEFVQAGQHLATFTAGTWCPVEIFGMVLDVIPWGNQTTTITNEEIVSSGKIGPFGMKVFSKNFLTTWEVSKARWLHAQGNPLPTHKLAGYLAEALLTYAIIASDYVQGEIVSAKYNILGPISFGLTSMACFTAFSLAPGVDAYLRLLVIGGPLVPVIGGPHKVQEEYLLFNWIFFFGGIFYVKSDPDVVFGGWFGADSAHYLVRVVAIQWWFLRIFLLVFRKIGRATMYTLGQPMAKKSSRSREQFPVKIGQLQDLSDSFLHVKGFSSMEVAESYRESVPGYGFIPHDLDRCACCSAHGGCMRWWNRTVCGKGKVLRKLIMLPLQRCRGIHSIYVGSKHFEIERNSGGGWKTASHRAQGWRARCTRIDHVAGFMDDIKWIQVKKEGHSLSSLIGKSVAAVFGIGVVVLPLALLASYPCSDLLNLRGRDEPGPAALARNPDALTWARWTTFNSTPEDMAQFDGAQKWCDAFDTSTWWIRELKPSIAHSGRPCVCPLQMGEICNPNLDPSLYHRSFGQPKWCSAWEQGTEFHVGDDEQIPREPEERRLFGVLGESSLLGDKGWPWPASTTADGEDNYLDIGPDEDWTDGHFAHNPSYSIKLRAVDDPDTFLVDESKTLIGEAAEESDRVYRSRDQPCECLTPMSTAFPEYYMFTLFFFAFGVMVWPFILFSWVKYQPWKVQLGVAGLGDVSTCWLSAEAAMHRLFKRRHAVELSQNINRLQLVMANRMDDQGNMIHYLHHGLDIATLILTDVPAKIIGKANKDGTHKFRKGKEGLRGSEELDKLFKRGHRQEFLGATLFKQKTDKLGKKGGWGALVTVRDQAWVGSMVYRKHLQVEKDSLQGWILVLKSKEDKNKRNIELLEVTKFPSHADGEAGKKLLEDEIDDFSGVLMAHQLKTTKAREVLHEAENQDASAFRHLSAFDQADALFQTLDFDSNGFLSKEELETLLAEEKQRRDLLLRDHLKPAVDGVGGSVDKPGGRAASPVENDEAQQKWNRWEQIAGESREKDYEPTSLDYEYVFGREWEPTPEGLLFDLKGEDAHLMIWQAHLRNEAKALLLMAGDHTNLTGKEMEAIFKRQRDGKLMESVAKQLDTTKLEATMREDGGWSVRDMDLASLKMDCAVQATVLIDERMDALDDVKKKALEDLKEKERQRKEQVKQETAEAEKLAAEKEDADVLQDLEIDIEDGDAVEEALREQEKKEEAYKLEEEEERIAEAQEAEAKEAEAQEKDKWAVLKVRLGREVADSILTQGLVDIMTLPGWLEAVLELILARVEIQSKERKGENLDFVMSENSDLSIEDQLSAARLKIRQLANAGAAKKKETGCCAVEDGMDDAADQDQIDEHVAIAEAHVQHLQAKAHKVSLQRRETKTGMSEDKKAEVNKEQDAIDAELERSDPAKQAAEQADGKRVIKAQFRRWFLEHTGGMENSQFGGKQPDTWAFDAVKTVQADYGTLMTVPDYPDAYAIDIHRKGTNIADEKSRKVGSKQGFLQRAKAEKIEIEKEIERIRAGTSVTGVRKDDEGFYELEATRSGISMQIARHRLKRPLRHGILAEWTYVPIVAKLLDTGRFDQLMLSQDYLRLRSASARLCMCPSAGGCRTTTSDFTMLLRDVTVIEMGTELVPFTVFLPVIWALALPLLWIMCVHGDVAGYTISWMNYVFLFLSVVCLGVGVMIFYAGHATRASPIERHDHVGDAMAAVALLVLLPLGLFVEELSYVITAFVGTFILCYLPGLFFFSLYGPVAFLLAALPPIPFLGFISPMFGATPSFWKCIGYAVFLYALGITISVQRGWTRRPYVYFGVLVGSSERAGSLFGTGTSPFWVRMARGQTMVFLQEVVDAVRNAAKLSLQQDVSYQGNKKTKLGGRETEFTFNPFMDQSQEVPLSAAHVLQDHVTSEGMGGLMLVSMEAVPTLLAMASNAFVILAALFIAYLDRANKHGEGMVGLVVTSVGFDDTKDFADSFDAFFDPVGHISAPEDLPSLP